jgi:WXG100 family type VII secretion target
MEKNDKWRDLKMAGGTEITSSGQMSNVAKSVEDINARYDQSVSKLYDLGAQVDSMWEGDASKTFKAQFDDDRERFMALNKMLTQYVETLRQDIATYHKAEEDAIEAVRKARR